MNHLIAECLSAVNHPRFFESERGFQGAFVGHLQSRLVQHGLPPVALAEQEYQKRARDHGLTIRPDIVVHVPAQGHPDRRRNNFLVIELKLAASPDDAAADFDKLDAMVRALDYAEAVFINVSSDQTYARDYAGPYRDRIHFFACRTTSAAPEVRYARWNGATVSEDLF